MTDDKGRCGQYGCRNKGAYRYTWPGQDEALVCEAHVRKLRTVAGALGMHLQLIRVREDER